MVTTCKGLFYFKKYFVFLSKTYQKKKNLT